MTITAMTCARCDWARINGTFCHETGCPNGKKTWIPESGWVRYLECGECGYDVEEGEVCYCQGETYGKEY